jgi:hypothetical protein
MKTLALLPRTATLCGLGALFLVGPLLIAAHTKGKNENSEDKKTEPSQKVVLEVTNIHFTMGEKIPSVYLRVFSDGTAECHVEKYTEKDKDIAKSKILDSKEFENLRAVINEPEMLGVKKRYELMHSVVDSWMEWDIRLQHTSSVQRIQIASFSPSSARERNEPYPDTLTALGCSILRIRNEVFAGENTHNVDCTDLPAAH